MPENKSRQPIAFAVHVGKVVRLARRSLRTPAVDTAARPHPSDEAFRQVLTAMAGLDALQMELHGACAQDRTGTHLAEVRAAAALSRRALCDAYPIVHALDTMELLHLAASVHGMDDRYEGMYLPGAPPRPSTVKRAKARMRFETMEYRLDRKSPSLGAARLSLARLFNYLQARQTR